MKLNVYSPCVGNYVDIKNIPDETFSNELLGASFAIESFDGKIYSPVNGVINMVFPTFHAFGIKADNGLEILVHIGLDTVKLNGNGIKMVKKQGDKVLANDLICEFNQDEIKSKGFDTTVIIVVTNSKDYNLIFKAKDTLNLESIIAETTLLTENNNEFHKYEFHKICNDILQAVGGKENIMHVFHCITRLRIIPNDKSLVDFERLYAISGLIKVIDANGQIQCVVGTIAPDVFKEFVEISGFKNNDENVVNNHVEVAGNKNIVIRGLNTLASCVTPGLYAIVAGGMIKGLISLIISIGVLSNKSDIISVLNAIGDAPFYFLPFTVGWAAAKRFKVKEVFGIMTAGILMYSTFLSPAKGVVSYNFILFDIPAYNYKASIFPVLLSVYIFSVVFHIVDKRMPKNLRIVFSGALSYIISAPLFLAFAAPLGNFIAKGLTGIFGWLFVTAGPLAGALFCGVLPICIIFGIKGWSAIELNNLATLGYDYMLPNFFYSNLAVSGAIIAYSLKQKGESRLASISTGLVCILGITEPALYGIALPEKKPLFAAMIGGAIAGALAMVLGVVTYSFSMPGITSIATYMDNGNNFILLLIVMLVSWCSSFIIALLLIKKDNKEELSNA